MSVQLAPSLSSLGAGKAAARLPRWVNVLLIVALGVALAQFTLKWLPGAAALPVDAIPVVSGQARDQGPDALAMAQAIAGHHLFGNASSAPEKAEPVKRAEPVVETKLPLQLAGVFAADPAENAMAIISVGSAEQDAFGIGDKVSGETTLKAVFPTYVLLDNRGQEEKLSLPENVQPVAMSSVPQAPASQQSSQSNQDFSQPVELPSSPGALRDTLARNPSMLGRVVAAEPYQENGKLVGYRIMPKQNPEILEAQGILAGDVITRVNNIELNSQKQGIRALRNAVKAENLEVTILRDGVEVPVNISLAQ